MPAARAATVACVLMTAIAAPVGAQTPSNADAGSETGWFPDRGYFAGPIANPLEPRFGVGLIGTDLLDSEDGADRPPYLEHVPEGAETDVQAIANVGGTLLLWRAEPWEDGGLVIGAQAGALARFRMEEPSRHSVATDWVVALPIEAARGAVSGRLRILHRSAHLGDELIESNGARRIEFGHEALELLVAYRFGEKARVYGGGMFVFRSNTANTLAMRRLGRRDEAGLEAGVEIAAHPWAGGRAGYVAGIDWQAAQRTGWESALSVAGGLSFGSDERSMRLILRGFTGAAPVGEFFLSEETFWGVELIITP